MRNLALAVALSVIAWPAVADSPRYRLDASGSRVVEISNLAGSDSDCAPDRASSVVKIAKRTFDATGLLPQSIVTEAKGVRELVNVMVDIDGAPAVDQAWIRRGIQQLTREGATVSVRLRYCGAAGRVVILDRIAGR